MKKCDEHDNHQNIKINSSITAYRNPVEQIKVKIKVKIKGKSILNLRNDK